MEKNAMQRLNDAILEKNSRICAGLDPTWDNIPESLKNEVLDELMKYEESFEEAETETCSECKENEDFDFECAHVIAVFRRYFMQYIDAICDIVPAIKINSAFFEEWGLENLYFEAAEYAKSKGLFVIGDVKRADIGSTSAAYAEAFLGEGIPFDAITINPYFGSDGVMPFLELAKKNGKGVFVLVKTSNKSSDEIQNLELKDGRKVYEAVADLVWNWAKQVDLESFEEDAKTYPMVGAVVGATHPDEAANLAYRMGTAFFLVPGYGAQGATADDVAVNFDDNGLGAIVNSSRGIMNAYKKDCWKDQYSEETWAEAARAEAIRATEEINDAINRYFEREVCVKKS